MPDGSSKAGAVRVLVVGSTGDVGGQVTRLLAADTRTQVLAAHRRPEQAADLAAAGAEPVLADLTDRGSLEEAMRDADRLVLITPPVPDQADLNRAAIDAAAAAGVGHVVRVSASDSHLRTAVPWARAHAEADHHLAASGVPFTVLRPSAFMQNLLEQAATVRRGLLPHTAGRGEVSWIDTADVAAVAALVVAQGPDHGDGPGHRGATYFLTGPESLSFGDIAERMTRLLPQRVRAVSLPSRVYQVALVAAGQSPFMAAGLRHQFAGVVRRQVDNDTTYEVERLLGRPPVDIDRWITENAARLS